MKRVLFTCVSLVLAAGMLAAQAPDYPAGGAPASAAAVSPKDYSLWVGTAGGGIRRTGRNGKVLHYDAARTGLPIDTILVMHFTPDGILHLQNNAGTWYAYSSLTGFVEEEVSEETPAPETVIPEPVIIEKKRNPLPWLLIGLLAGAACTFFLMQRKPSSTPAIPKQKPIEEPKVTVQVKTAPPAKAPEAPAAPVIVHHQPQNEKSNVESPAPARVKEESLVLTPPEEGSFSEQVERMIRENLSDPDLNVETIAARLGISRIHVNRKMQKETGTSPSALITRLRMEKAAELLTGEKRPVAEVAGAVGFVTASYFSSAFRKFYGMTPKEYTKKNT